MTAISEADRAAFFQEVAAASAKAVWCALATVSLPAGAKRPMTDPAPMVAPSPTLTGATNAVFEPMNASSAISKD